MKSIFKNIYTIIVGFLILAVVWQIVPQRKMIIEEQAEHPVQHFVEILLGVILFTVIMFFIIRRLQ